MKQVIDGKRYVFQWKHITDSSSIVAYLRTHPDLVPHIQHDADKAYQYGGITICEIREEDAQAEHGWREIGRGCSICRLLDMAVYRWEKAVIEQGYERTEVKVKAFDKYEFDKLKGRKWSLAKALEEVWPNTSGKWRRDSENFAIRKSIWDEFEAQWPVRQETILVARIKELEQEVDRLLNSKV